MSTIIIIYTFLAICLGLSIWKSRAKTVQAFKMGAKALWNMAPSLLAIVGLVGLILGILPPETISRLLGVEAGITATMAAAVLGAVTLIPALVSFPLAGSLLASGATVSTVAVFITTLVMVGTVTAPLEIEALGEKKKVIGMGCKIEGFDILHSGVDFHKVFQADDKMIYMGTSLYRHPGSLPKKPPGKMSGP